MKLLGAVAAAALIAFATLTAATAAEVTVPPGATLVARAAAEPAGTTFLLEAGTYTVGQSLPVQSGDRFVGAGMYQTIINGQGLKLVVDAEGATDATLKDLTVRGARGTEQCKPRCGRGAIFGANGRVSGVRFTDNANQGVGGSAANLVVVDSLFDHNGSSPFNGCCGGGIKNVEGFTLLRSTVRDNIGNGVWCDRACPGGLVVEDSLIENNTRNGIHYEVSRGDTHFSGNIIRYNNIEGAGDKGGIKITGSQNVDVFNNDIYGNKVNAIRVSKCSRNKTGDGSCLPLQNITIHGNRVTGRIVGCGLSGVTCTNN